MPNLRSLALGVVGSLVVVWSCTEKGEPQAKAPSATPLVVPSLGPAPPPSSSAPLPEAPGPSTASIGGAISAMELLADNTLAIATPTAVLTIDAGGTVRSMRLKKGEAAKLDSMLHGDAIVIESKTVATMRKSPTLEELWSGPGTSLAKPHGAVVTSGSPPTLYFVLKGALERLDLPAGPPRHVDALDVTESKRYGVVTFTNDGSDTPLGLAFDLTTKASTGKAEPMPSFAYPPKSLLVGDSQIAVAGGEVMEIALATGRTRKQKVCTNPSFANPIPSPGGDLLLVTCGNDGLGLDPKTFGVKRRYPRIMPGCDNGDTLPAHFDAKTKTELVIEGCGGEARLDTTTGKYRCSDGKELVGSPYPGMASPGEVARANVPTERLHLPRCSSNAGSLPMHIGATPYYEDGTEDAPEIVGPSGRFRIEAGASVPVISADESRLAYELRDRVVIRSLPAGKVLSELRR